MARLTTNTDSAIPERNEFEVLWNKQSPRPESLNIDGRVLKFGRNGFKVHDAGLARELDARYGFEKGAYGDIVVVPTQRRADPSHQRTFSVRLPKNYKRGEA